MQYVPARSQLILLLRRVAPLHEAQLVAFVQQLRTLDLKKLPSVSETIDWARVLVLLHAAALEPELVRDTLNVVLKFEGDIEVARRQVDEMIAKVRHHVGADA